MAIVEELPAVKDGKYIYKVLQYSDYSSQLKYQDFTVPVEFNPHQLLIKIKATSVNPADILFKGLSYKRLGDPVKSFGGDFAGVVVKTGTDCKFEVGDKVFGNVLTPMKEMGSFGEYLNVLESQPRMIRKIPEGMSFEVAASLPVVFSTPFQALSDYEDLKGKNVLILGGGTAVGTFGVQLAKKYFKAGKVVSTCSGKSADKVKSCGADLTVDYTKGDEYKLTEILKFVKENGKFDFILDTVRDYSLYADLASIAKGQDENGIHSLISGSNSNDYSNISYLHMLPTWPFVKYLVKSKIWGMYPKSITVMLRSESELMDPIAKMWKEGELQISIDSEYDGLTEFQAAIDRVASFKASGKVICKF